MPYIEEICVAGNTVEVSKYYTFRYNSGGEKRQKKVNESKEWLKKANDKKAARDLRRLINTNFKDGDLLVRLDFYKTKPKDSKEMQEMMSKTMRALKYQCQKLGHELRYIYVKEIGPKGSRHIHMVMSKIDVDVLRKVWTYGGIHIDPLISDGQYRRIADYFVKYSNKTSDTEGELVGKRWYASRNLKKPVIHKRVIASVKSFRENFKTLDGYHVEEETVQSYISEITGYQYFSYTLLKTVRQERGR